MNRSNWLLMRMIPVRLVLGALAVAGLSAFLSIADPAFDPQHVFMIPLFSLGATLCMGLWLHFNRQFCPVSDRQRGWLPLVVFGTFLSLGVIAMMLGQLLMIDFTVAQLQDFSRYWLTQLPALVWSFVFALILWRISRINIGFFGFFSFAPALLVNRQPGDLPFEAWTLYSLPLALAAIALLVWDAPAQARFLRQFSTQSNNNPYNIQVPDLSGPIRLDLSTRLADAFSHAAIASMLLVWCHDSAVIGFASWRELLRPNPFLLLYLAVLIWPALMLLYAWRQNRASGMNLPRAALVLLLRATLILEPFKDCFGVQRGQLVRCDFCARWRFPWQSACPHCAQPGEGLAPGLRPGQHTIPARQTHLVRPRFWGPATVDQPAFLYRVMLPLQLAIFILVTNWSRWFH